MTDRPLAGLHVLVVDDQEDALEIVEHVFEQSGAVVVAAHSAREAFAAFLTCRPNAIVSDISMPEESGNDLIRKIRQLPAGDGGTVPAVALSAAADRASRHRALEAGFDAFEPKPVFDTSSLIALVFRLARSHPAV
ncbi:MAG: response regulator [Polyangiaceae bacterium]